MHILVLSLDNPLSPMGGLGVQIYETYKRIKNVQISIVCQKNDKSNISFEHKNITLYEVPEFNISDKYSNITNNMTLISSFLHVCLTKINKTPTLIHAYDWNTVIVAKQLSDYYKCPLFFTMALSSVKEADAVYENNNENNNEKSKLVNHQMYDAIKQIEENALNTAEQVFFVSESYRSSYSQDIINKSEVLQNGIDFDYFNKVTIPKTFTLPGRKGVKKLLYMGRLVFMKNVNNLLNAKLPENVDLLIAGDLKTANLNIVNNLKKMLINPNLNVYYCGKIKDPERLWYLNSVDAVIIPSIHEPFGIVGLEALATNNIVLSSMVDGLGDFTSDVAIYCGTLKETIENSVKVWSELKEEQIEMLKQRGVEASKKFTWDIPIKKLVSSYEKYSR